MNTPRKKILYVITKSNMGGAQRYVMDLASALPREQFDVAVAFGGTGSKDAEVGLLEKRLNQANIRTVHIKNFIRNVSVISDIRVLLELITLFRTERPDVVHLNSSKAVVLGALAGRVADVPHIVGTVHGWAFNETRPWWQKKVLALGHLLGVALCHTTIVVSKKDRTQIASWPFVKKITVVLNGVAPVDFLSREDARKELTISADAFVIGSIGELTKNKNYQVLVEAVVTLQKESPKTCSLVVIGSGEEKEYLKALSNKKGLGDNVFVGFIENAARLLRAYDIFVLPSLKEGLPYVLLEAGQASLPVIATNVGGVSEIIEDKETGVLVEPNDTHAFCDALQKYINSASLREEHGRALQKKVLKEFSLEIMIAKIIALYTKP